MDLLKEAQGIAPAKRLLELLHALPVPHEQVEELALAIAAYAGKEMSKNDSVVPGMRFA